MSKSVFLLATLLAGLAPAVHAAEFEGVYRPAMPFAAGWSCEMTKASGNGLVIAGETLTAMGSTCTLAKPVPVRDMAAVLYDASCESGGETQSYRVMVMKSGAGVLVIRDGSAVEWPGCQ